MPNRKPFAITFLAGVIALLNVVRNPRFETIHTVDVLQLIGCGMCFGIALMALFGRLKPRSKA